MGSSSFVAIAGTRCIPVGNTDTEITCTLGKSSGGAQELTVNVDGNGTLTVSILQYGLCSGL